MFDWLRQYNFMVLSTPIFMPTVYKFTLKVYVIVSDHKGFGNLQKRKLIHSSGPWCTLCCSNIIHVVTTSSMTNDTLN